MDRGNVNSTQHLPGWLRETTKETLVIFVSTGIWIRNSPNVSSVTNFDRRLALCIQKIYHRPHFTVSGSWNKSPQLQPLQRCSCENSGSSASASVMRRHYFITYMQSLHPITGLLTVGRVRNLLCGLPVHWVLLSRDIRSEGSITIVKKFDFDFYHDFFYSTSLPQSKNVF